MRPDFTLSVIVPVFNERLTVRNLVEQVRAVPIRKQIILVDDCSTDGTADVIRAIAAEPADALNRVHAIFHEQNAGKGAAIRTAIPAVEGELALIQDADLEYDPREYPILIQPILDGHADVVFGSRFLAGPHRVLFFRHMIGNRLLTLLSNLCTDLNLTDMETCYKVFRSDVLRRLHLVSDRFGIEPEITAKVARLGCRVYEVPISYHGREYWEGKKIGWRDGVAAIWTILRFGLFDDRDNTDPSYVTLRRLRHARRYDEWLWGLVRPFVGDRVLEVGCGIGHYTGFLRNHALVVSTDADAQCREQVAGRLGQHERIRVEAIDWEHPDLDGLRARQFDTVLCLNALARIADDDAALATFASLLPIGGRLVLQVPAMPGLFGETDRALGLQRRYEREALRAQLARHGFAVESARYLDLPGLLGGLVRSRLLRRPSAPAAQARLASALVPWLSLEQRFDPPGGLSLLVAARKERETGAPVPFRLPPLAPGD